MSVPTDSTTTSGGTTTTPSQEVENFVADQPLITHLTVPERDCPECHRTMHAVAIFLIPDQPSIWHLKCGIHRLNDYAVVMDSS